LKGKRQNHKCNRALGKRIIIAGGGTGGHIFPAIAIAQALKSNDPEIALRFVGAKGKMEMQKIPEAGFDIEGIDIAGFNRSSLIKNFSLPFKLIKSFFQVKDIINRFRPDAVIGVGGYSSFPVLRYAESKDIPCFIHESNSFAGKSNMLLAKKARKIFVATDGMEKFFPPEKILVTGNPVRKSIVQTKSTKAEALEFFGLMENKLTLLVIGGSLGAKSINEAIDGGIELLIKNGLQVIWQTGKGYAAKAAERAAEFKGVWSNEFIKQMDYAFSAADIVVSRSGAMTIAELCLVGKPVIFVPYPFAAEDHQTANAKNLVDKQAGMLIRDDESRSKLVPAVLELINDRAKREMMEFNIKKLGITNADERIAREILDSIGRAD
jgi:UDP-N-acetylglucosamine--N-acetylmuramyl-(pentapeptide) pyrophosphoryl-undecaprenol N-acetylglucosamine transferase